MEKDIVVLKKHELERLKILHTVGSGSSCGLGQEDESNRSIKNHGDELSPNQTPRETNQYSR